MDQQVEIPKPRILFVDDKKDLVLIRSIWLEEAGYEVEKAYTVQEAREILANSPRLDLAILDLRLEDEYDETDISGFTLAQETIHANIPTLILTAFPSYRLVRLARGWFPQGLPHYLTFMDKSEGSLDPLDINDGEDYTIDNFLDVVKQSLRGRYVFLVHGRQLDIAQEVGEFIEELGLVPILLKDQVNLGRTISEKLADYANVAYTVVLMTPDDLGGLDEGGIANSSFKPRARQNVIFELGYFVALLGTARVAVLKLEELEMPSNFEGVVYIPIESDGKWKEALVREMRISGLNIQYVDSRKKGNPE